MTMTLQEIVREETEWMFGDIGEGQGIGSSDISACMRNIIDTALSCDAIHTDNVFQEIIIRGMISDALCEMEGV